MKFTQRAKAAVNIMRSGDIRKNALDGLELAKDFRRRGNRTPIVSDWSQTVMADEDMYTGYPYAALNNRANKVAQLAESNLMTKASAQIMDKQKKTDEPVIHPYLDIIDTSKTFTNYAFWYTISTYLDLPKGEFYLMAVRNFDETRYGEIKYFKLLNPYDVAVVRDTTTREVEGYIERKNGMERTIPPQMIIPIKKMNPFNPEDGFGTAAAAQDNQFTLKTAGDHTRHAIQKSINAPGLITVGDEELALNPEQFENFKARITGHEKGEPIFGIGKNAVQWEDMQIDMNKTALNEVNEVNLNGLIAVTGTSKTKMGIEQSGVTRDSSKVQSDQFIGDHIIPQLQLIIDALNQDYKNAYSAEFDSNNYKLYIDSPLGRDRDAEKTDTEIKQANFDLYNNLVNKGYDREIASKYVQGDITLEELGEPTNEPEAPTQPKEEDTEPDEEQNNYVNALGFDENSENNVTSQQSVLQAAIDNIDRRVVASIVGKLNATKNKYEDKSDIINKTDREEYEKELAVALAAFYLTIVPLFANRILRKRTEKFDMGAVFAVNSGVRKQVQRLAKKAAQSHINTVTDGILEKVRQASLEGKSQYELERVVRDYYNNDIAKYRAKAIARTETNRAFTMSQLEADSQFLAQNPQVQGFKQWHTRSDNPCPYCLKLEAQGKVPFDQNFVDLGESVEAEFELKDGKKVQRTFVADYEEVKAGNLHVNCSCDYTLTIEEA